MSIRLILFFPLVSNYCQVMQLDKNEMYRISCCFFIDDLITQESHKRKYRFFSGGGGGGGGGGGRGGGAGGGINCQRSQTSS